MVRKSVMLAVADTSSRSLTKHIFRIYKPNTGLQSKVETLTSLREKGTKVQPEDAKHLWTDIHECAEKMCGHILWYGNCRRVNANYSCDIGLRKRIYHILSGSVLSVWSTLEKAVPHMHSKLQIVRLKTKDGLRVIGTLVPHSAVESLLSLLSQSSQSSPSS
ncbi:hypothetical protein B4U80_08512 [Leptotrombidium deliense]|uniref:SBNO alpha/beta domain-containing protein n=1 Tax=Leptotrombidium deliense TaxID=299467 RepID=A0A443S514_9ACAR|nr:hypothetical protein B4U80_08512 [Leptotrombidium deliense]